MHILSPIPYSVREFLCALGGLGVRHSFSFLTQRTRRPQSSGQRFICTAHMSASHTTRPNQARSQQSPAFGFMIFGFHRVPFALHHRRRRLWLQLESLKILSEKKPCQGDGSAKRTSLLCSLRSLRFKNLSIPPSG